MKQTILVQLLAACAAGAPVVERQQAGVDAAALGQAWIEKVEAFASADKRIELDAKKALINNMSKCFLTTKQGLDTSLAIGYFPKCREVPEDTKNKGGAEPDAAALGQAWIAKVGQSIGPAESPQTRQKVLELLSRCTIHRELGLLIGDPDEFITLCPPQQGDVQGQAAGAGPAAPAPKEKIVRSPAKKEFLAPASLAESDKLCGSLSGPRLMDEEGTSEACVGTEVYCLRGFYVGRSEDFADADECINSRAQDEDAIIFPSK